MRHRDLSHTERECEWHDHRACNSLMIKVKIPQRNVWAQQGFGVFFDSSYCRCSIDNLGEMITLFNETCTKLCMCIATVRQKAFWFQNNDRL